MRKPTNRTPEMTKWGTCYPANVPAVSDRFRTTYTVRCEECNHIHRTSAHTTCPRCGSADLSFESN